MSTLDVVAEILREVAPRAIKSREIARLAGDRLPTQSRTPETEVYRDLAIDVKRHGTTSRFLRADRGAFLLKEALPHAFYNDVEPYVAQWTRNLIAAGEIAAGVVDERSIRNLRPADVASYRQCHFFSGVGVWSRALRDAEWPDDANVWSGSCPCTPFSAAGRKRGFSDEQHLWPEWFRLIKACRPSWIFGEQVSSKDGLAWIDAVRIDLEGADYTLRVLDLPAASVGAPHRRQRLYFVAYARERRLEILRTSWLHDRRQSGDAAARRCSTDVASSVSDAERIVRDTGRERGPYGWEAVESDRYGEVDGAWTLVDTDRVGCEGPPPVYNQTRDGRDCFGGGPDSGTLGMGDAGLAGSGWDSRAVPGAQAAREGERIPTGSFVDESLSASADDGSVAVNGSFEDEFPEDGGEARELVRGAADASGAFWKPGERIRFRDDPSWGGAVGGFWVAGVEWIYCRPEPGHEDGRWRPAQSEVEPLAYGPSVDMGRTRAKRLRGFGNAIVLPLATEFVASVLDVLADAIDLEEVKSTPESTVAEITSDPEAVNVDPVAIPIVRESADLDAAEHVA